MVGKRTKKDALDWTSTMMKITFLTQCAHVSSNEICQWWHCVWVNSSQSKHENNWNLSTSRANNYEDSGRTYICMQKQLSAPQNIQLNALDYPVEVKWILWAVILKVALFIPKMKQAYHICEHLRLHHLQILCLTRLQFKEQPAN